MKPASTLAAILGTAIIAALPIVASTNQDPLPPLVTDDGDPDDECTTRTLKKLGNLERFKNENGRHATYSISGGEELDLNNPFFRSLGTNGRACASCHAPEDAFSLSLPSLARRFEESCGTDPVFAPVDGTDHPNADRSTLEARRAASNLLLKFGVIRMELPLPAIRDFDVVAVDDPTGNVTLPLPPAKLEKIVVFRRPLMASNLRFPTDVIMHDGREPDLSSQAINATRIHAESGTAPSPEDVAAIVDFETNLFTTQVVGPAGRTTREGAAGDPVTLSILEFFNDMNRPPAAACPPGTPTSPIGTTGPCRRFPLDVVDPDVFHEFDAWASSADAARQSVARGQAIFNRRALKNPVQITNPILMACSNCHNIPGSGGGSGDPTNVVGISNPEFRIPEMPLYTVRIRANGRLIQTTDPGQAMTTGIMAGTSQNAFKTPQLRGLAAHAPYFHNGMSRTIEDVVDFYNERFKAEFTAEERADLVAFLKSL